MYNFYSLEEYVSNYNENISNGEVSIIFWAIVVAYAFLSMSEISSGDMDDVVTVDVSSKIEL